MSKSSSSQTTIVSGIAGFIVVLVAIVVSLLGGPSAVDPTPTLPPSQTAVPGNMTSIPPSRTPSGNFATQIGGLRTEIADPGFVVPIPALTQGTGLAQDFWAVYFTAPTGNRNPASYVGGIDSPLAQAINEARGTIDIAAFEFNNPLLTEALLMANRRGVRIRMVTDDEHGLEDFEGTVQQLINAGIPVVDDGRTALMHNKFVIIDSTVVWTGSTNFTINGVYRNNNNLLMLRSRRAVQSYQAEFNEMFEQRSFGPRSPQGNAASFNQDGTPIQIYFAAEDQVVESIITQLVLAESHIRFMAFSFTLDEMADVLLAQAQAGISVEGIFETVGSETVHSELTPLFCAGLAVRQDGNPFILHHKVFIIDDDTVVTGSFNFSANATRSNDENLVIIENAALVAQYLAEFDRRWAEASTPTGLRCS